MRVGVNATFLRHPHTGTGAYLQQLLVALSATAPQVELTLYVPDERGPVSDADRYAVRRLPVPPGLGDNWGKLLFEQVVFPRAAAEDGCDVLHVPHFAPPFWHSEQTVVTVHDLVPLMLREYSAGPQARAYSLLVASAARRSGCLLADSKCSARDIVQRLRVPASRLSVAYLAASSDCRPVADPGEVERARRRYSLPNEYVLYYGGYDRRKQVQTLLEAYASLRRRVRGTPPLVLAGRLPNTDGSAVQDPRPVIERLGLNSSVVLTGAFEEADKAALLGGARCFVFASVYEGFGLPPLEAMACGAPVVAARSGSLAEVCGGAAVWARPGSVEGLADGLVRVLSDGGLREELVEAGLRRAGRFRWADCASVTLAAYTRTATEKR